MAYVAMTDAEETENLRETLAMLNDRSERLKDWQEKNWSHDDAVRMRRMFLVWIDSRYGTGKLRLDTKDRERLEKFVERIRVSFDGGLIDFYGRDTAAMNFTRLLRNSQRWRLRGPCPACHAWYLAKTNRKERDYCSRKCAGNAVSARKRKRERDQKIEKARAAIQNYVIRPIHVSNDWKQYVSRTTKISKRFLTVAVRDGELVPPEPMSGL